MPARKPSKLGVHVPVGTGLARGAVPYARAIGAEALQVFSSNPRGWAPAPGDRAQDAAFRAGVHHDAHSADRGAPPQGVLDGPDRALRQLRELLLPLLDAIPDGAPRILVEPTAGGGEPLAARIADLAPYLAALDDHPRLGICLDTCHLHAAGHDLSEPGGVRTVLNALLRTVGRGRLGLMHVNDSKDPAGSGRDRHERVGTGTIGLAPFAELFRHPATGGVPLILETPGARAEHRADLALLRSLRDG